MMRTSIHFPALYDNYYIAYSGCPRFSVYPLRAPKTIHQGRIKVPTLSLCM